MYKWTLDRKISKLVLLLFGRGSGSCEGQKCLQKSSFLFVVKPSPSQSRGKGIMHKVSQKRLSQLCQTGDNLDKQTQEVAGSLKWRGNLWQKENAEVITLICNQSQFWVTVCQALEKKLCLSYNTKLAPTAGDDCRDYSDVNIWNDKQSSASSPPPPPKKGEKSSM